MTHPKLLLPALSLLLAAVPARTAPAPGEIHPPPGSWHTSWVGNTFGGDGGPNGLGYWVQDAADEIQVTPDGTVIAGCEWDEAGRCIGLYKDGKPNRVLLKEHNGIGKEFAWGFGTANDAVAAWNDRIYAANTGKKLMRFSWKPGDLDSAHFLDEVDIRDKAIGLDARGDKLVVVYPDLVELRSAADMTVTGSFGLPGARDAVIAPDGSLWIIAGKAVLHTTTVGIALEGRITDAGSPSAIAFDNRGRLLVCDDGLDQQVKTYRVDGKPLLLSAFGMKGGLKAGTPGEAAPQKLFSLRGAGTDAAGNLYVAMSFGGAPSGHLVLRSFTPGGKLRWEVANHAFVDTFGFDPASDGSVLYSRTGIFDLDLSRQKPGSEWSLRGISLDTLDAPDDPRIKNGMTAYLRHLQGRRLLACIGQYGGGYFLYGFDEPHGSAAHTVGRITEAGRETWAWDIDDNGDIWQGDAAGNQIIRTRFGGWSADGKPKYGKAESWPWPDDFQLVRRAIYQPATDTLYLFGYLKSQKIDSWGVVGFTGRRYDGWLHGAKTVRWTKSDLPMNPTGSDQHGPLSPSSVSVAGDYLFLGMVKPEDDKQYIHILNSADGSYVGSFYPGPEVGGNAGWLDMPYSVQAMKRKDGEYLILAEEDWRGKNLLYRWRPKEQ